MREKHREDAIVTILASMVLSTSHLYLTAPVTLLFSGAITAPSFHTVISSSTQSAPLLEALHLCRHCEELCVPKADIALKPRPHQPRSMLRDYIVVVLDLLLADKVEGCVEDVVVDGVEGLVSKESDGFGDVVGSGDHGCWDLNFEDKGRWFGWVLVVEDDAEFDL